jgi:hypothetical protein
MSTKSQDKCIFGCCVIPAIGAALLFLVFHQPQIAIAIAVILFLHGAYYSLTSGYALCAVVGVILNIVVLYAIVMASLFWVGGG